MTLTDIWKRIEKNGPQHILLNKEGETQMLAVAKAKNPDLSWDVVYIRNDGWSLGADFYLAQHAEALFRNDWIAVIMRGQTKPRLMNFTLDKTAVLV